MPLRPAVVVCVEGRGPYRGPRLPSIRVTPDAREGGGAVIEELLTFLSQHAEETKPHLNEGGEVAVYNPAADYVAVVRKEGDELQVKVLFGVLVMSGEDARKG